MQQALSAHHRPGSWRVLNRRQPNVSRCLSLSAYLLDAIVISMVSQAPARDRRPAKFTTATRTVQAWAGLGRAARVAAPTHMIDWEMP